MPTLTLPAHYYRQHDTELTADIPGRGFAGWTTRLLEVPLERSALVSMHAWNPGLDPRITLVWEVYTQKPRTIAADERVARAVDIMIEGHFRHLPVTSGGTVHGTLSMRDLTQWLTASLDAREHGLRSRVGQN